MRRWRSTQTGFRFRCDERSSGFRVPSSEFEIPTRHSEPVTSILPATYGKSAVKIVPRETIRIEDTESKRAIKEE